MVKSTLNYSLSRPAELKRKRLFSAGEGRGEGEDITQFRARELRKNSTDAENYLWRLLRSRRLNRYKFRRQYPVGIYFVDFVCIHKKLVIELDGGQHADAEEYDSKRSSFLRANGYKVIRFWNNEVFTNTENVLGCILLALGHEDEPSPLPSPAKEVSFLFNSAGRERE